MNRFEIIITIIILIFLFAIQEPRIFTILLVGAILLFLFITNGLIPALNRANHSIEQEIRRNTALRRANMFLAPYKSIWGDLKLSNKHCYLYLDTDGVTIYGSEKVFPYRKFRVIASQVHSFTDLWDMFCISFSHTTTYEGLIKNCELYQASIYEYAQNTKNNIPYSAKPTTVKNNEVILVGANQEIEKVEKIDINNCSEIELTELQGISIVMAKKAIKKREEIGGFKTIEDFFLYLKLKPHMESQLRTRICVKKMKTLPKKKIRNEERSVDL